MKWGNSFAVLERKKYRKQEQKMNEKEEKGVLYSSLIASFIPDSPAIIFKTFGLAIGDAQGQCND